MGKTKIVVELSPSGISAAIRAVEAYRKRIERLAEELRLQVAEQLRLYAESAFQSSMVDVLLSGDARNAEVTVEVSDSDGITLVIANGEDAVFAEFGAGVYFNTPAGSSLHPEGERLGFTIGSFGKGNGVKNVWGYYADGELRLTHGTPASMPLYTAARLVCSDIETIARGVFT